MSWDALSAEVAREFWQPSMWDVLAPWASLRHEDDNRISRESVGQWRAKKRLDKTWTASEAERLRAKNRAARANASEEAKDAERARLRAYRSRDDVKAREAQRIAAWREGKRKKKLAKIPPVKRSLILSSSRAGMTVSQIASAVGLHHATVRMVISTADVP